MVTPTTGLPAASAMPRAADRPTRRPVKLPGPVVTAMRSSAAKSTPARFDDARDQRHQRLGMAALHRQRFAARSAAGARCRARRRRRHRARYRWRGSASGLASIIQDEARLRSRQGRASRVHGMRGQRPTMRLPGECPGHAADQRRLDATVTPAGLRPRRARNAAAGSGCRAAASRSTTGSPSRSPSCRDRRRHP